MLMSIAYELLPASHPTLWVFTHPDHHSAECQKSHTTVSMQLHAVVSHLSLKVTTTVSMQLKVAHTNQATNECNIII